MLNSLKSQVGLLAAMQALVLTNNVTLVAITGLAGFQLADNKLMATLPVTGYVLGNYAKAEMDPLADMLGAIAAEAEWLAKGDDARFMSDLALRLQE